MTELNKFVILWCFKGGILEPYYKTDKCKLYKCDNLELMKSLPGNYIDLIYCDILYNTGKRFNDYDDNLGTPQEAILWYKPRLIEMKRILKNTGLIYMHCDFHLSHYIKIEMDEIFGYDNFIDEIIWYYDNGGGRSKTHPNKKHDNLLMYGKTIKFTYNLDDIRVPYKETSGYAKGGITSNSGKQYSPNEKGKNIDDVWLIPIVNPMSKERNSYDTQKPIKLLNLIIKSSSNKSDIVADFFMGSGTTGEAALELGRKFIGCDIGDKACKISQDRLEKLMND